MTPTINNQSKKHFKYGLKIGIFLITQVSIPLLEPTYVPSFESVLITLFLFFVLNGVSDSILWQKGAGVAWWLEHTICS